VSPNTDPLAPVQIGVRQLYDELRTVGATASRVEAKVDHVDAKVDGVLTDVSDHEARIRALERNRWPLPSLAALVAVASLVIALINMIGG
jgi:hypothetical protein